jgi:hypothetical protein
VQTAKEYEHQHALDKQDVHSSKISCALPAVALQHWRCSASGPCEYAAYTVRAHTRAIT